MRRNKLSPKEIKTIYKTNVRKEKYKKALEHKIFWERLTRLVEDWEAIEK